MSKKKDTPVDNSAEFPDDTVISQPDTPISKRFLPNTEEHDNFVKFLMGKIDKSSRKMSQRYPKWREAEANYHCYKPLNAEDLARKDEAYGGAGFGGAVPFIMPMTFSTIQTMISYMVNVFFAQPPFIELDVLDPDDAKPARNMEAVLDYQAHYMKMMRIFYFWCQDCFLYGGGFIRNNWSTEYNWKTSILPPTLFEKIAMIFGQQPQEKRIRSWVMGYDGNYAEPIDVYRVFPDPSVPIWNSRKGEFMGVKFERYRNDIKKDALSQDGKNGMYFNIDEIEKLRKQHGITAPDTSQNQSIRDEVVGITPVSSNSGFSETSDENEDNANPLDQLCEIEIKLIPKEHKLSTEDTLQKWICTIANNKTLIRAEPMNYSHDEFTILPLEFPGDFNTFLSRGVAEQMDGLQRFATWICNTREVSVRKNLHDKIIANQFKVNIDDLKAKEVRVVRLLKDAEDEDIRSLLYQFQTNDITANYWVDLDHIMSFGEQMTGAIRNLMGLPASGTRSATEIRTMQVTAGARLKGLAEYISEVGVNALGNQWYQNCQQFMTIDQCYRILGSSTDPRLERILAKDIMSKKGFKLMVRDGNMPVDRFAQAGLLKELLQLIVSNPAMMARYNTDEIINDIGMFTGLKNVKDYQNKNPQPIVTPDQIAQQNLQAGNGIPPNLPPTSSPTGLQNSPYTPRMPVGGESTIESIGRVLGGH